MLSKDNIESFININGPIKLAIAGVGSMSKGLINQISHTTGIKVVSILSRSYQKAQELSNILENDKIEIVDSIYELVNSNAQMIVDLTGDVEFGARLAEYTIKNNKHILVNTETDATVGVVLSKLAKEQGVIYTNLWGDEPSLAKSLYDYASVLGFEIIALGKFKNFHDCYSNPDTALPWAKKSNLTPHMVSSFNDGSRLSLEMTVLSNATGFVPDTCGMHMPKATKLEDVTKLLKLKSDGGILNKEGVIEVVSGPEPSGAVFAIIRTQNDEIVKSLNTYKLGDGPNYMLYTPYHMPSIEMVYGIFENFILNKSIIQALEKPVSDAIAFAKRDLNPGMFLDSIGGFDYFGKIETAQKTKELQALPLGLAENAKVLNPIKKGDLIKTTDVEILNHDVSLRLRKEYDKLV